MAVADQNMCRILYRILATFFRKYRAVCKPRINKKDLIFDLDTKAGMAKGDDLHRVAPMYVCLMGKGEGFECKGQDKVQDVRFMRGLFVWRRRHPCERRVWALNASATCFCGDLLDVN